MSFFTLSYTAGDLRRAVERLVELVLRKNIRPMVDALRDPESDSIAIEVTGVRLHSHKFRVRLPSH
jgi:hypothetical protein